jgi:hypothetical protein
MSRPPVSQVLRPSSRSDYRLWIVYKVHPFNILTRQLEQILYLLLSSLSTQIQMIYSRLSSIIIFTLGAFHIADAASIKRDPKSTCAGQ